MNRFTLILKSFLHYLKANLMVAAGVSISTAVLTGGLIIGDSVTHSLEQITLYRLGKTTHTFSSNDRFFRLELASEIESSTGITVVPVLLSEAVALTDGGVQRVNRVQVIGLDNSFEKISDTKLYSDLGRNEIIISENLAERLKIATGDNILLRIKKESLIPLNAPFVDNTETSVSFRATVKTIVTRENLGGFSLKNSQTAPFNVFMSISRLNELMEFEGKANTLLMVSEQATGQIEQTIKDKWKPEDANLVFRLIEKTGEVEILSERVFLDSPVFDVFGTLPGARGVLTYFVNGVKKGEGVAVRQGSPGRIGSVRQPTEGLGVETPYSFVSTLPENELSENEIIINQWMADDLNVGVGDSLELRYFVVGPLRQLEEKSSGFVIKKVVGLGSRYADETLMPFLPGLSDAGHCRDWEAGVPIDLDKIRDKDEKYWNDFKGTPKAFISIQKAQQLWSNRFGNYTSIRFNSSQFNEEKFREIFKDFLTPASLGFLVTPVKEKGMVAAQNGVDFSQLFIGLSFFLLLAAILLSGLLFLLNFESRVSQIGTLTTLGFKPKQVRWLFLTEGIFISVVGALAGLVLAILYTRLVFSALNSLWYDIVRTNVLEIKLLPLTLLGGFFISVLIAVVVIGFSIRRKMKQQIADIQKKIQKPEKRWAGLLKFILASLFFIISLAIILEQFLLNDNQNPSFFFMSGGLILVSLLLFADRFLQRQSKNPTKELTLVGLSIRNTVRNKSRSLSILILFAIGTFLVISTGSNKQDMFSGAEKKSSGTGGFLYFAETTMPVLFDLNDPVKKAEEGLSDSYHVVQFSAIEGDDASCLNLNRVSNPAILGVDPSQLKGRFSFTASTPELNKDNPWSSLEKDFEGGVIPAFADQTVIQWGLGKKMGDILFYLDESGDTLSLKLIGGLAPSIFQGNVLISNKHFLKYYPTNSGSKMFLIDGTPENKQAISDELQLTFRDYGWEQVETARRLADFYSVTNTYLSIFLALGALALVLGTIGLAIVMARSILERKPEIALLESIGFSRKKIFSLITREYIFLLFTGVLIGTITAVVATLPAFLSVNTGVSIGLVFILVGIILANGLIWIVGLTWLSLRNKKIITSLRNE